MGVKDVHVVFELLYIKKKWMNGMWEASRTLCRVMINCYGKLNQFMIFL